MAPTEKQRPTEEMAQRATGNAAPLGRMIRNSAFNFLGMGLILPFNFIALFVLARRLGKTGLGIYFTIFAISSVIHWVADAGIMTVITQRIARTPEHIKKHVAEATGLLLIVCTVSISLFFLIAGGWMALQGMSISWMVFIAAAVAIASRHTFNFAANALRGLERFEYENIARVLQTGLFCLLVVFLVDVKRFPQAGGTLAPFVAYAVSNVVATALISGILLIGWRCAGFRLSPAIVKDWLRESAPLGIGDTVRRMIMQLDTLLLAAFASPAAVGLFSIAFRPLQPLQLLPRTIVSVTFPMMSRLGTSGREEIDRAFGRTSNLLWMASLPIALTIAACARPLILATAGADFLDAVLPLQILMAMTGLFFLNAQLRFILTAMNAQQKYGWLVTSVLGLKLALELALIPLFGLYGACFGALFGELALWLGGLVILGRLGFVEPRLSRFVLSLIPAGLMGAVLYPATLLSPTWASSLARSLHWPIESAPTLAIEIALLLVAAFLATALYCGTSWLTGAVDRDQVRRIWSKLMEKRKSQTSTTTKTTSDSNTSWLAPNKGPKGLPAPEQDKETHAIKESLAT